MGGNLEHPWIISDRTRHSSYAERPTGYAESDVYVCLSRYNEVDKEIKRAKGWKVRERWLPRDVASVCVVRCVCELCAWC